MKLNQFLQVKTCSETVAKIEDFPFDDIANIQKHGFWYSVKSEFLESCVIESGAKCESVQKIARLHFAHQSSIANDQSMIA